MSIKPARSGLMRSTQWALLIVFFAAGCVLCIQLADWTADRLIRQRAEFAIGDAATLTTRLADSLASEIDQNLRYLRGVPVMLSRLNVVKKPLRQQPAALAQLGVGNLGGLPARRRMELGRTPAQVELGGVLDGISKDLGIALLMVLNRQGICIAASNTLSPLPVAGLDLSDRLYFDEASTGQTSEDFAIGHIRHQAGLFFAAPIVDQQRIAGVVAIKVNLDEMTHWISDGDSFIADRNGVVILAHDPQFVYRALPDAPVFALTRTQRMAIYHRIDFEVLARAPFAMYGMRMLETLGALPNPVVVRSKATQEGGLSVYAVTQVGEIAHIRVERQRYFWLALLTYLGFGAALASSAAYYMRERRHMKETVALNISLLRLNQDLEHEVRHDPLTGIYNRGYFVKLLAAAIAAAQDEPDSGFCVAVIDLDFFKLINDNHGHAAGDQALLGFVAIGRAALRSSDSFARIGGEEFAVLLPHTDAADAGHVIERLRQQLEATPIAFKQHSLQLTCSAGLTVYQAHDLVDRILRRADKALYYAKAHGRNQVVDYSDMNERTAAVPAPVAPLA